MNKMKLSVIGTGYVGASAIAGFYKLGHKIICVDKNKEKVELINKGKSPLKNNLSKKLIKMGVSDGNIKATLNLKEAILNSKISFVCVETPAKKDGSLNLNYLKDVCKEIGKIIKHKKHHIIVIKSTMFPGSLDKLKLILEKYSGKKCGKDFDVAVNPEFLRAKTATEDFLNPSMIVVGTKNKKVGRKVMSCYKGINTKRFIEDEGVAQMIKYASNSFHALKVVFTNEISAVCKKLNVDSKNLMELFCKDTHLNISTYYFKPGEAYGGLCLPKDLSVLQNNANRLRVRCPIIKSISESNEIQIKRDRK